MCKKQSRKVQVPLKVEEITIQKVRQDEKQPLHSARSLKSNIVSARSQGNPKVNDVSINNDIIGLTVKPCNIRTENKLTTWKQIVEADQVKVEKQKHIEDLHLNEKQLENDFIFNEDDMFTEGRKRFSCRSGSTNSSVTTPMLNQTYSLRDLMVSDKVDDIEITKNKKWKPVRHSPRIEFCLGDPEKTNQVYVPPVSPILSGDTYKKEDTKNSRKNLKEEDVKSENSKYCLTKDEGMINETDCQEDNSYFKTFDVKSPESYKSTRSRILERKGLNSTTYADISERNCINSETIEPQKSLYENNVSIDTLNSPIPIIKGKISSNHENTDVVHTNENTDMTEENTREPLTHLSEENLFSSPSYEQFANLNGLNDFCETSEPEINNISNNIEAANQEVNQVISYNDRPNSETNQPVYIKYIKKVDNEFDIDTNNSTQSFQSELGYPLECGNINDDREFYSTETNWNEIETDPYFMEIMLQPTRSSTPFVNVVQRTKPKFEDCEDSKEEQCTLPVNSEWKEEIDSRTGSEVLYRVESRGSNCLSPINSCSEIDKLEKINSKISSPNRTYNKFNKNLKNSAEIISSSKQQGKNNCSRPASSMVKKKEKRSPRDNFSIMQTDEQIKFPKIHKKEIASQINICKCPLEVFPSFKCEKSVNDACIHTIGNTPYSEPRVCSTTYKNMQGNETLKEPLETQETNFNKISYNDKLSGSSINQFNQNMEDRRNYKKKVAVIKENSVGNKTVRICDESTAKEDDMNNEVQEIYSAEDFNCDSDNSIEHHVQDTMIDFKSSTNTNHNIKESLQSLRSIVLSESCVKLSQRIRLQDSSVSQSTALKSRRLKTLEIENSIRENTSLLNESSDSLASSNDATDLNRRFRYRNAKQVESVEVETIEEIGTRNRSIKFRVLPKIKGTTVVVKDDYHEKGRMNSQTYWEKASKASRNRLINLDPPYQGASRFLTRNPKVRILPPLPSNSSLINQR